MQVLHLVPEARGGICRHAAELCQDLQAAEWKVRVAGPPGSLARMVEFGLPPGIGTIPLSLPARGPLGVLAGALAVRRIHLSRGAILHAHGYRAGMSAAGVGNYPLVVTAHNLPPRAGRGVLRLLLSKADAIIAISEAIADALLSFGIPQDRVRVIPNGIRLQPLPTEAAREQARTRLLSIAGPAAIDSGDASCIVMGIGRLSPEKDFEVLLRAFDRVRAQQPNAILIVVGEGPERGRLEAMASSGLKDLVFLPGHLPDVRALLAGADLIVIPSREEGQSLVALEALAAGVRVVASNVGGLPGMICPGQTGWLARPGDPEDLARQILDALAAPPDSFTLQGRQLLEQRFDARRTFARVVEVYEQVIGDW